jgi:hypothetical protein
VATAQLKLVGKVAVTHPAVRARALAAAARAFGHERLDVQQAALKLIARLGVPDDPDRAVIAELASSLAPALRRQAAALGLPASSPALAAEPRAGVRPAEPAGIDGAAGAQLPPPLEDPAELIQLLTQLREDASDPLAVERVMAGAVRLAALPSAERARLAAPLLARAGKRLREDYDGPFSGYEITSDIAALTLAWGSGWSPDAQAFKLNRVADGLRHASPEPAAGQRIVQTIFAAGDRLVPAKPANLHLLFELAAGIATATSEPPASITRIAHGGTRLAAAARLLTRG